MHKKSLWCTQKKLPTHFFKELHTQEKTVDNFFFKCVDNFPLNLVPKNWKVLKITIFFAATAHHIANCKQKCDELKFKKDKRVFFVLLGNIYCKGNIFNIFVLSQSIVYWINFIEYTYFYISKNITSYTLLLVFKIVGSLQCVLNNFLKPKHLYKRKSLNPEVPLFLNLR